MLKKTYRFTSFFMSFLLAFALIVTSLSVAAFADETYISEITVVSGENGRDSLENQGYTVLFQGLNLVSDDSSTVTLGYKKGTDAVTGLVISSTKADSIEAGGIKYQSVSGVNLNEGTDGTAIYLYYTKDKNAGGGITKLDTVSGFTEKDDVIALKNDGSSPVRTDGGKLANFDDGISGNELYMLIYRGDETKPYISSAAVVTGSSPAEAVKNAADSGYDCYLDSDLDDGDAATYIAYNRTADKSGALTAFSLDGTVLKTEKSGTGAYLLDISGDRLFTGTFTVGDWAEVYASGNKQFRSSSGYDSLKSDTDECSCVPADSSGKVYCIYLGKAENGAELTTAAESGEETVAGEILTDEYLGIEKDETESAAEVDTSEASDSAAASALGSGSIIAIIAGSVLIILVCAGLIIYKVRKGRRHSDEEK